MQASKKKQLKSEDVQPFVNTAKLAKDLGVPERQLIFHLVKNGFSGAYTVPLTNGGIAYSKPQVLRLLDKIPLVKPVDS
jgi:hypothetical protein